MGYKPGTSLGRTQSATALKEPLKPELKVDRTGLGHEADRKRKLDARWKFEVEVAEKRRKAQVLM